jgi:hypothetical protein
MALSAVFGITNDGLNLVVNLLLLFLVVLWVALVYWTYADARRRIEDSMLVTSAVVASLFPFVGTVVYMIVRPPEYLEEVHERELEIAAAEARLAMVAHESCPYCHFEVEKAFLRCPNCLRRLKEPCGTCGKPLDSRWRICPYCEAEVAEAAPAPRRRERRRESPPGGSKGGTEPAPRQRESSPGGSKGRAQPAAQQRDSRSKGKPAPVGEPPADPSTRDPQDQRLPSAPSVDGEETVERPARRTRP